MSYVILIDGLYLLSIDNDLEFIGCICNRSSKCASIFSILVGTFLAMTYIFNTFISIILIN